MADRQGGRIAPHGIHCGLETVARPDFPQAGQIVADQQRPAALAQVPLFAGFEFSVAQTAFEMRH